MANRVLRCYMLIPLLVIYIFISDFFQGITGVNIKPIAALLFALLFAVYIVFFLAQNKDIKYVIIPFLFTTTYAIVWDEQGYLNLIYTPIFSWLLSREIKLTIKIFKVIIFLQLLLVIYERLFTHLLYASIESGVFAMTEHNYGKNMNLFEITGFRPKGLFSGTLVATSFTIYMSMIFRNNTKILFFLLLMALIVNGRLALLVTLATFFLHITKRYTIAINGKLLGPRVKMAALILPFVATLSIVLVLLPGNVVDNYMSVFDFAATSNAGRIYSYAQALLLLSSYSGIELFFGLPGNEVYDIYGRIVASESGLISMALDIGFIGLFLYLIAFIFLWLKEKKSIFSFRHMEISLKYVAFVNFLCFIQYEHINGNVRGTLFWFIMISALGSQISLKLKTQTNGIAGN